MYGIESIFDKKNLFFYEPVFLLSCLFNDFYDSFAKKTSSKIKQRKNMKNNTIGSAIPNRYIVQYFTLKYNFNFNIESIFVNFSSSKMNLKDFLVQKLFWAQFFKRNMSQG